MTKQRKVSLALSPQLVDDLDYLAGRLGISRSALVSEFLTGPIADVRRLLEMIPPGPTPADLVRLRGESTEIVRARLESLKGITDDLFSK